MKNLPDSFFGGGFEVRKISHFLTPGLCFLRRYLINKNARTSVVIQVNKMIEAKAETKSYHSQMFQIDFVSYHNKRKFFRIRRG